MIEFVASERQYAEHLLPIWEALPVGVRGRWVVSRTVRAWLVARGLDASILPIGRPLRTGGLTVVASWRDLHNVAPRPAVMVQHGAGQTYDGDPLSARHPSYSGGAQRDNVVLNLATGPLDAERLAAAQPTVTVVEVGCPKLDRFHTDGALFDFHTARRDRPRTVAVSWHAEVTLCPESRSAWPHYGISALEMLRDDQTFRLLGHAHPRRWPHMARTYRDLGIEPVEHFDDVLAGADLYVVDNSSTAYEFASLGRPVVLLNAPWYRRDVRHGLRFWDLVPGRQVDDPSSLLESIHAEFASPDDFDGERRRAVDRVYAGCDGYAAYRAASAILEHLESP